MANMIFSTHFHKLREVTGLLKKQLTLARNHERNLESFIREIHDAFHSCKTQHVVLKRNIENLKKTNKGLYDKSEQLHHQVDQLNEVIRKYKIHWVINAKTFIKYNLLRRKDNG
jgi:predicted  nucleic acid-binding Zn-ribbon protein